MWVRGLKLDKMGIVTDDNVSHPMWVRGLKPIKAHHIVMEDTVAPHVGAWIETMMRLGRSS